MIKIYFIAGDKITYKKESSYYFLKDKSYEIIMCFNKRNDNAVISETGNLHFLSREFIIENFKFNCLKYKIRKLKKLLNNYKSKG